MTPADVIASCQRRGVALWREGDALRVRALPGVVTASVKAALSCQKEALLPLLSDAPPTIPASGEESQDTEYGDRIRALYRAAGEGRLPEETAREVRTLVDRWRLLRDFLPYADYLRQGESDFDRLDTLALWYHRDTGSNNEN